MKPPLTPQLAAREAIAAVGPSTAISTDPNVSVAGQSAYELVLAPKDLLRPAVRVSGPWGSGQLIRTRLLDVPVTGNTIYAGAVGPSVLYAAAARG